MFICSFILLGLLINSLTDTKIFLGQSINSFNPAIEQSVFNDSVNEVVVTKIRNMYTIGAQNSTSSTYTSTHDCNIRSFRVWQGTTLTSSNVTSLYNDRDVVRTSYPTTNTIISLGDDATNKLELTTNNDSTTLSLTTTITRSGNGKAIRGRGKSERGRREKN